MWQGLGRLKGPWRFLERKTKVREMERTKDRTPFQQLSDEHIVIMDRLEALRNAVIAAGVEQGEGPSGALDTLGEAMDSLARKLEVHLVKEEAALFPAVEVHLGAHSRPVVVMRMEHEDLRENLVELQTLVAESRTSGWIHGQLGRALDQTGDLLVQHTHTEHHIFLPMAEALLDEAQVRQMAEKFREIERRQAKRG